MGIPQKSDDAFWNEGWQRLLKRLRWFLLREKYKLDTEKCDIIIKWLVDSVENWFAHHIERITLTDLLKLRRQILIAIKLGSDIYDAFIKKFSEFFYPPTGKHVSSGEIGIRNHLKVRFPGCDEGQLCRMTEAIHEIILSKRLHLLNHAYHVKQNSLFEWSRFNAEKLLGYFAEVVRIESYNIPPDLFIFVPDDNNLLATMAIADNKSCDFAAVIDLNNVDLLKTFWSVKNGFEREGYYEGMISSGLGEYIDDKIAASRALVFRLMRMAIIEAEAEKFIRKISQLLYHKECVELSLKHALKTDPQKEEECRQSLCKIEDQLMLLRGRLDELQNLLKPKPREVAEILDIDIESVRKVRRSRINREISTLKSHHKEGIHNIKNNWWSQIPVELKDLIESIEKYIKKKPLSPSAHGLSDEEKRKRENAYTDWEQRGSDLTQLISEIEIAMQKGEKIYSPTGLHVTILDLLADSNNYFQFGLSGKGISAGLEP